MANYFIRYDNNINSFFPTGLTKLEMNAFMYILSRFYENPEDEVTIPYRTIRDIIKYNPKRTSRDLDDVLAGLCIKISKVSYSTATDNEESDFSLFSSFTRNWYERELNVAINPRAKALLSVSKGYTQFDIREFISLKSKAAKYIFINLKQFRSTGIWHIRVEDFKARLGACGYSNNNCIQKLVNPAIEELTNKNIFSDLKVKVERSSAHGSPVTALLFIFKSEGTSRESIKPDLSNDHSVNISEDPSNEDRVSEVLPKIEIDSMFCAAEALLRGRLSETDIESIANAAKKFDISPYEMKRCIYSALGRDNVSNLTGYIISLIRGSKKTTAPSGKVSGSFVRPFYAGFKERTYDYEALFNEVVNKPCPAM